MSVGSKSLLFPGLAARGVAYASSKECEQVAAADTQDVEASDEDSMPGTVTQQIDHKSHVAPQNFNGNKVSNQNTSGIDCLPHHLPNEGRQIFHAMNPRPLPQITREKPSPTCSYRQNHLIGRFCFYCRGMEMPWGDQHPIALDTSGEIIHVAPQGALLEGVKDLTAPYEITQLAVLIELRIQLQSPNTIPGFAEAIHMFPDLPDVARRISDLVKELRVLADGSEREQVPNWPNALHDLLREPTLSRDQYFERAIREWNLKTIHGSIPRVKAPAPAPIIPSFRLSTRGRRGFQVTLTREDAIKNEAKTHGKGDVEELTHYLNRNESRGAGYVQFTIDFVDWLRQGAHGTGRPAPQWGPHYVQQYHSAAADPADPRYPPPATVHESSVKNPPFCGQLNFFPRRNSEPNTTPRCSEELSDVEVYDSNDGEDYEEPSFRKLPEVKKNTPCRPGVEWQFIEGSDLENAELGKPDPSKFYLTRVNVHDPSEIDVRQFSGIAGFDWNDPSDIKALNKSRAQNRHRVQGKIAETRIPWTKMEKDCLLEEVQEAVNSGLDRHTIDWDEIAARLQERFDRVLQKKGAKLAPGIDRQPVDGKKDRTLKTSRVDRIGYNRSGSATETQALKYPDILQIINQATGIGGKGGRGLLRGPRRSLAQMRDGVKDEEDDRPTKKTKGISRRFTTSPPPRELKKHDDDDDDDENERPSHQPKKQLAMPSAFDSRFTKNKAKQFDANSGKE
ncbi:hypothetical protein DSL72_004974 [Monilinia vaccinii-corymbosi]|uniref:Uncharacterized protein n=1 Tax=Monilinia vaccinii-corymbosi TaxID=61207 RepID=A0A8A3PED3_9HELO|nr:hypothetical protein DSL72_004974 [Monilinia vaccinii-corymbosi]